MKLSRREFLESSATAAAVAGTSRAVLPEDVFKDGPATRGFFPISLRGNADFGALANFGVSKNMAEAAAEAPRGELVCWGLPFEVGRPVVLGRETVAEQVGPFEAGWLVFLHTTDRKELERNQDGFLVSLRGQGDLGEIVAEYVIVYQDGTEVRETIRRRHQVGMFQRHWGENCFQAVAQAKPHSVQPVHERVNLGLRSSHWGWGETRATTADEARWMNWLWAWENPHPDKPIVALRFERGTPTVVLSGVCGGKASSHPLRWEARKKAILRLPKGTKFEAAVNEEGLLSQVQLDMGQVISAEPLTVYPNESWADTYPNKVPEVSADRILVEYTCHPDAHFHVLGGQTIAASELAAGRATGAMTPVQPANRMVTVRVVEKDSGKAVPAKLHVHGESGEYLAPVDRHRLPNSGWFEDYSPEFQHSQIHRCVYMPGETRIRLPLGRVYLEVTKGFEIRPVRKVVKIGPETEEVEVTVEKVLPWREKGWVTADTHVHFLSPPTALLEGEAEGVNVVNLLASQWGELMTNVGDFDGKTTYGSKESGGGGEWLVRVGTENRQHVLGHISLLGYRGNIIAPMCSGGPDEAALGDPVETLLMEWAEQCRQQGGLVVLPHFPNPRCENAADLITGAIDAVEMTSWGDFYSGIDPYSLADYYRYLNCGYFVAAVGGTDKMSADTAVGTVRTYARIDPDREFTYEAWLNAVRSGHTFVTYGPLLEFSTEGQPPGSRIEMKRGGGTLDLEWSVASVILPMSRIELVVNGEIREGQSVKSGADSGRWSVKVDKSSWLAVLVRGKYSDKPEMIAAHSSPVMVRVDGSDFFSAPDALVTLEQIEGALAYLDTVGTRAEDEVYKRMRLKLTAAYRKLHNELHQRGHYHHHTSLTDHEEHQS